MYRTIPGIVLYIIRREVKLIPSPEVPLWTVLEQPIERPTAAYSGAISTH